MADTKHRATSLRQQS